MTRSLIALFLFALTVLTVFAGIRPQWNRITALRAEIQRLQALGGELAGFAGELEMLAQAYEAIPAEDVEKVEAVLPRGVETAQALIDFETLAARSGLALGQVNFADGVQRPSSALVLPGAVPSSAAVHFTMSLRGSYEALRTFLSSLERNLRLSDVTAINFGSSESTSLSISVQGQMYYRP